MNRWIGRSALLAVTVCSGCINLTWSTYHHEEAPAPAAVARVSAVGTELGRCLAELGAPHLVFCEGHGVTLAYAWSHQSNFGLRLGYSVGGAPSASFQWSDTNQTVNAVVLRFDRDLHLVDARRGFLRDLAPPTSRRTAVPAAQEQEDDTDA